MILITPCQSLIQCPSPLHKYEGPSQDWDCLKHWEWMALWNIIFIQCADLLVLHLGLIYRETFTLKMYTKQWKNSVTVILRKLSKPDYTNPGAHCPIMISLACIMQELVCMAKTHKFLPDNHFRSRP